MNNIWNFSNLKRPAQPSFFPFREDGKHLISKHRRSLPLGLIHSRPLCGSSFLTAAALLSNAPEPHNSWEGTSAHLKPAALSTLTVLEWERLCRQVAGFAQTTLGQRSCCTLHPASDLPACEALLAETRAVDALEAEFAADIDFGGIQTLQAAEAIQRASRGGLLTGSALLAISTLFTGTARLQKSIQSAAKEAEFTGLGDTSVLQPVLAMFNSNRLAVLPELVSEIGFALREDGGVRESASDEVKKAAGKVRTLEGRIRGILKNSLASAGGGEISEHSGRMCIAIAAGAAGGSDGLPKGAILLGSGPGGAVWFVEPSAAVPLNNELAGARGELAAAEEAVLWRLTGKVSDESDALHTALESVVWLDSVAARARYGRWINGTLPEFVAFPKTGKARGGSKKKEKESVDDEEQSREKQYVVYLKKLRHPLLLGDYLIASATRDGRSSGGAENASANQPRLPGWRPQSSRSGSDSSSDSDSNGTTSGAPLSGLPVAIDLAIPTATKAVVITGPNTGGKTATLKALGLAALAARAGLPVPASAPAFLPCFDSVLADIGDEQSLTASLSTFSGHLRRIEALRTESTGKSLVLLDELGTGTDPTEGAALGIALMKVFAKGGAGGGAVTVATTHHSALTSLKYEDDGSGDATKFENASVEFDEVKLAPTYKLLWGVPGRSNALNIAQRLELDAEVVEDARERLGVAMAAVNESIVVLEDARKQQDEDEAVALGMEEKIREAKSKTATLSVFSTSSWLKFGQSKSQDLPHFLAIQPEPTLVVYVFSGSDPEYLNNLKFFIREAVKPGDGCEYVIVIQQDPAWPDVISSLPLLPTNARYLYHPNECFDLGTVGWVLKTQISGNLSRFKYFIWLNSSVRGPFLPPYLRGHLHWTRPFTTKLHSSRTKASSSLPLTKLVGSSVNCGGAHGYAPEPHIQSYITATDSIGLEILLNTSGVFNCWETMPDVVLQSEIGSSRAILDAGYNLDCLMARYQNINWHKFRNASFEADENDTGTFGPCNMGMNPLQSGFNDGINVDPYEVMFVKVKRAFLEAKWSHAMAAVVLDEWLEYAEAGGDVPLMAAQNNAWLEMESDKAVAEAEKRGKACFDFEFYLDANAYDIGFYREVEDPEGEAWDQFVRMGIYEGRPYRWKC